MIGSLGSTAWAGVPADQAHAEFDTQLGQQSCLLAKVGEPGAAAKPASANAAAAEPPRRGPGFGGPVVLGPNDKPAFDDPPAGFDSKRDGIPHGKLEMIEDDSKTVIRISQGVHALLKENNVPHVWHVDSNGHDATHWRNNLWLFSQRIFK